MKNNQLKSLQHHLNRILLTGALMLSLIAVASAALTADHLDPTWGNGGVAANLFTDESQNAPLAMVVQPDGKILVSGRSYNQNGVVAAFVARYNANGTLDQTFGTGGKIVSPPNSGEYISSNDLILQPDGKIVAAGFKVQSATDWDFAVARYDANGTLDVTFGTGGKVFTAIGNGRDIASNLLLQPDGKIVATGNSQTIGSGGDFAAVRYNPDGSLDTSFGNGGKVVTDVASGYESTTAAILQPDGKIIVGGYSYSLNSDYDYAIVRYNADGSLDSSFGNGGKVITSLSSNVDLLIDVALQADGKIVTAGTQNDISESTESNTAIVRYNPNGSIDTTFATNGVLSVQSSSGYYVGASVTVQPNGKILAAGLGEVPTSGAPASRGTAQMQKQPSNAAANVGGSAAQADEITPRNIRRTENARLSNDIRRKELIPDARQLGTDGNAAIGFAAARYNQDGSPDTSFGNGGVIITRIGLAESSYGFAVATSPDGKIFVCGSADGYSAIARYQGDSAGDFGRLDTTFGKNGKVRTDLPDNNFARQVEVQPDGKIVALAWQRNENGTLLGTYLIRYNPNGTIDNSFGTNGVVGVNCCQTEAFEDGFVILPDGKLLVAGDMRVANAFKFTVFRLNADGTRDATWGTNGVVTINVGNFNFGNEIIAQPDGKIVVLGEAQRGTSGNYDISVARLNPDGTLDNTFGTNGVSVIPIPNSTGRIRIPEVRLQADGKFLFLLESNAIIGAARINADGSLDTGFAANGFLAAEAVNWNVRALALQPDGKFVLVTRVFNGFIDSTVARYNANGTLDTSFGTNGKVFFPGSLDENFNITAVVIQPNGKIVVGGSRLSYPVQNFGVLRLNPNGSIETNFGTGGFVTVPSLGALQITRTMALQPDGKLVVFGEVLLTAEGNIKLGLARILLDAPRSTQFDFDGDGKADIAVFRQGNWYITNSSNNSFRAAQFGFGADRITPADFDGDGRTDLAVFRDGTWYLQRSTAGFTAVNFGQAGDAPVPADYDGDGRADVAVFRAGNWYILQTSNNTPRTVQFGLPTDKAVPADYDGDGKTDVAVYRDGTWYLLRSRDGFEAIQFGQAGDQPVPADYDADGRADAAVFRAGVWYLLRSTQGFAATQFGLPTDIPVPADYDGDGRTDIAVYRDGVWYLLRSASGFSGVQFGLAGDKPIPSAFAP